MSALDGEFESYAEEFNAEVLRGFRLLLSKFVPGDGKAFSFILQSAHKVDITPRELSDMADVSPNTIKRWTDTGNASKYHQRGLVADIQDLLDQRRGGDV